jgi:hypothetical protein
MSFILYNKNLFTEICNFKYKIKISIYQYTLFFGGTEGNSFSSRVFSVTSLYCKSTFPECKSGMKEIVCFMNCLSSRSLIHLKPCSRPWRELLLILFWPQHSPWFILPIITNFKAQGLQSNLYSTPFHGL